MEVTKQLIEEVAELLLGDTEVSEKLAEKIKITVVYFEEEVKRTNESILKGKAKTFNQRMR